MTLFEKFFKGREDMLSSFSQFDLKHNLRMIEALSKETNEIDFLSTVTEIHFGLFFNEYSHSVKHEKSYNGQTPDWTIEIDGQQIIAEVLRLNPSSTDKEKLDFDEEFASAIHQIMIGCCLSFEYYEEVIDRKEISIQQCKHLVENWLRSNPSIDDKIVLYEAIEIQLIGFPPNIENVCLLGGSRGVDFNYNRLRGSNSTLTRKAKKYSSIIKSLNLPYIVCIYMDFHSWFKKEDLYSTLYGLSAEHEAEINYFSHDIEKALFYSDKEIMTNLSGILLRQNDEFTYYHNYSKRNRLNTKNTNLLLRWQHPYR